jgi:RNA polymerase sigma factor (sigma-70 family)
MLHYSATFCLLSLIGGHEKAKIISLIISNLQLFFKHTVTKRYPKGFYVKGANNKKTMTTEEFNTCVDDYADSLYRFLLKNIKSVDKANDIVQDTYERLWMKKEETEHTNVKSFMFTIAYNLMLKEIERSANEVEIELGQESEPVHTEQYSDMVEVIQKALEGLPEKQRWAIILKDLSGFRYEEIATIMETETDMVRQYIFRGRIALKKHLVRLDNVI